MAPASVVTVPTGTPPRWVNALMAILLRTPGLRRRVGGTVGLITVTGRRTGTRYTTPVTYYRNRDTVLVLTRPTRSWWRNLDVNPVVELRLAGRTVRGTARACSGAEQDLPALVDFLEHRPRDAKAYGLTIDPDGRVDLGQALALLPQVVVVQITVAPAG